MKQADRFRAAQRVAGWHLVASLVVVAVCAALIYGVWYPGPFDRIVGVTRVLVLMALVDAVCGPLLTLVLFDPMKARWKWRIDMLLIATIQLSALAYGMDLIHGSRPVFLALEGDRFRLVQQDHVPKGSFANLPEAAGWGWSAPQPIGVRLLDADDPGYLDSVQQAAAGVHPAFRPDRWIPYSDQVGWAKRAMRPVGELQSRATPDAVRELDGLLRKAGLKADDVGYLPLASDSLAEWSVILNKADARLLGVVSISGWAQ